MCCVRQRHAGLVSVTPFCAPSAVAIAVPPNIAVRFVEATTGVEPVNSGFAALCIHSRHARSTQQMGVIAVMGDLESAVGSAVPEEYCIADCGCAGGQLAASCAFDPWCPRCEWAQIAVPGTHIQEEPHDA
jgi:hypothetical protein